MKFSPVVTASKALEKFSWLGKLGGSGACSTESTASSWRAVEGGERR
jgi:hypothetical protein